MTSRVDIIKRMNDSIAELELQIARGREEPYNTSQILLRMLQIRYESRDRLVALEPVPIPPRPVGTSTSYCSESS